MVLNGTSSKLLKIVCGPSYNMFDRQDKIKGGYSSNVYFQLELEINCKVHSKIIYCKHKYIAKSVGSVSKFKKKKKSALTVHSCYIAGCNGAPHRRKGCNMET